MFKIDIENTSTFTDPEESVKEVVENKTLPESVNENNNDLENQNTTNDESQDAKTDADNQSLKNDDSKYWTKLKKERAAKKELAEELERVRYEKMQMEELLQQSLNTGATHYKNNVTSELEMAQARLQLALESGDAASVARATADISKATHALNEAAKINNFQPHQSSDNIYQAQAHEYENRLNNWLDNNPELDKNTSEYDENLTKQALSFIKKLDRKYELNNRANLIGSVSYYNIIDEYLDNLRMQDKSSVTNSRHFGAVSNRRQAETLPDRISRDLTDKEKKAAIVFGISEEKYKAYLEKDKKERGVKNGN